MKREELTELHFITSIANIPTLLKHGIQSHHRAEVGRKKGLLQPVSVAMQEIQVIRANKSVPGQRPLHTYANLYFCARNPMLFKRKEQHLDICVLRVHTNVLDSAGAIITDRNAAASIARFTPSPAGLAMVDKDLVFADDWRHPNDLIALANHRAIKCAELLIPDQVAPTYIQGAYVSCAEAAATVTNLAPDLPIEVNGHLFFLEEPR